MERRALAQGYDAEHRIQDYPGGRKNSWFQCSTLEPFVNAPRWRWDDESGVGNNPVQRGYVDAAEHWRYSSARVYAGMEGEVKVCMDWCL